MKYLIYIIFVMPFGGIEEGYDSGVSVGGTPHGYVRQARLVNNISTLFDGGNEFGAIGLSTNLEFTRSFAISSWVKSATQGTQQHIVDTTTDESSGFGYAYRKLANNRIRFFSFQAGAGRFVDSNTILSADTWYLITVFHDMSDGINHIFINDALDNSSTVDSGNSASDTTNLRVASANLFPTLTWDGNLDEITFWDLGLNGLWTVADQQELYNGGTPIDIRTHTKNSSIVTWYRMGDGDTFPTVRDIINGNDMDLQNMEASDFVEDVPVAA